MRRRRKRSKSSRIFGGLLMVLSLIVTLAGLGTAVYLERLQELSIAAAPPAADGAPITAPIAPQPAPVTSTLAQSEVRSDPLAASAAVPSTLAPPLTATIATPPATDATTGSSSPTPPLTEVTQELAVPEPPAANEPPEVTVTVAPTNPPVADQPEHYWVEYGVFAGERYAQRLQQSLADLGLDAMVTPAPSRSGRHLVRVRSAQLLGYAAAHAAALQAQAELKIDTLIHRTDGPSAPVVSVHAAPEPVASSGTSTPPQAPYWVQFGAYPHHQQAARFQERLASQGIDTVVISVRGVSGRTLYCVRSVGLNDRTSALAMGQRGQQATNADFLVGQIALHSAPIPRPKPAIPTRMPDDG
jgi:cell division protein FtsN